MCIEFYLIYPKVFWSKYFIYNSECQHYSNPSSVEFSSFRACMSKKSTDGRYRITCASKLSFETVIWKGSGNSNFSRKRVGNQVTNSSENCCKSKKPLQCKRQSDMVVNVIRKYGQHFVLFGYLGSHIQYIH
jgi:hypothetical protein